MAKQADMKMTVELSEYDRALIQQLITAIHSQGTVIKPAPIQPWNPGLPYQAPNPIWCQTVTDNKTTLHNGATNEPA